MSPLARDNMARATRLVFAAAATAACLLTARPAGAQTTVTGGNVINQTWTPAGSPYIVQGDVTVPAGASLTIQAGTVVQFAATDGQAAGMDTGHVELTIKGTLNVNGSVANPVTFQAQSGTAAGSWYGIVIDPAAAGATIAGAIIKHASYGVFAASTAGIPSVTESTFDTCSNGFYAI